MIAKLDIKSAYRIVPVHPDDRLLLGMRWKGKLYVNTAFPFSLRSAPKLFNAVADALAWVMGQVGGATPLHYPDDFLFLGRPGSGQCKVALEQALQVCGDLGIPISEEKLEGPDTVITSWASKWILRCYSYTFRRLNCSAPPADNSFVGKKKSLYEERIAFPDRSTSACLSGGEIRANLPSADDLPVHQGEKTPPSHSPESMLPVRPAVVGRISSCLEWHKHNV